MEIYGFQKVVGVRPFRHGCTVMKPKLLSSGQHGFSLVELLVVIAVIAIIAAIAIPNIANITSQAETAKARRNAQNISSVASAAKAAGVTEDLSDRDTVIGLLETGVTNSTEMRFGISPLAGGEAAQALSYLGDGPANGGVLYLPDGSTN